MRSLLACFVFVAACGARTSTPTPTPRTGSAQHQTATPPPNPSGPTEPECDVLLTHVIGLVAAERQTPPPETDTANLRAEMRPAFIADCRAGSRDYHQCGLAAKSSAELDACRKR